MDEKDVLGLMDWAERSMPDRMTIHSLRPRLISLIADTFGKIDVGQTTFLIGLAMAISRERTAVDATQALPEQT